MAVSIRNSIGLLCIITSLNLRETIGRSVDQLPGPSVYVVTPASRIPYKQNDNAVRSFPEPWQMMNIRHVLKNVSSTTSKADSPDLVLAEFQVSDSDDPSNPKSIRQLLAKERIDVPSSSFAPKATTERQVQVQDIWDIIRQNQKLDDEIQTFKEVKPAINQKTSVNFSENPSSSFATDPIMNGDVYSFPGFPEVHKTDDAYTSRAIDHNPNHFPYVQLKTTQLKPAKRKYSPHGVDISPKNNLFTTLEEIQYEKIPATGEAQDRYNPAQPRLPGPAALYGPPMERPYSVMAPPPPPHVSGSAPVTYDSFPSFDSLSFSGRPPSTFTAYQPPPPPPSSDTSSEFDSPPAAMKPSSDDDTPFYPTPPTSSQGADNGLDPGDFKSSESGNGNHNMDMSSDSNGGLYPELIFDKKPHHHEIEHDHHFKFHDIDDFYHDHHHHHVHHTTTTTTTTEKPEMRVNNRYSYYYIGKKLWYLPLYFSVYFIIYVGALIIKAVLRHKITYPNAFRTRRSTTADHRPEWLMKDEYIHYLTRRVTNAISGSASKYFK